METPSVRVLVVGDSGVGKTTLLRSICRFYSPYSVENEKPSTLWTTGCDVHVLLTSLAGSEVFVEFLDVGGHPKYERSRTAFYHNVHGLLLVHDVSNAKSGEHLRTWSHELSCLQKLKGCVVPFNNGKTHDRVPLYELPTLVIGNKTDLGIKQKRVQGLETSEFKTIAYLESVSCLDVLINHSQKRLHAHELLTMVTECQAIASRTQWRFRSLFATDCGICHSTRSWPLELLQKPHGTPTNNPRS